MGRFYFCLFPCLTLSWLTACSDVSPSVRPVGASDGGITAEDAGVLPTTAETAVFPDAAATSAESETTEPVVTEPLPFVDGGTASSPLVINELMASNDGAWIDGVGETDDWVELLNTTTATLDLSRFTLEDSSSGPVQLPALRLASGARVVFYLDDETEQGERHLPMKLSASRDELTLRDTEGAVLDAVSLSALGTNESWLRLPDAIGEFEKCRYASPGQPNGNTCSPPPPPSLESSVTFAPYDFPADYPRVEGPLIITELALRPASFVEIANVSDQPETLTNYVLRASPHGPGIAWPTQTQGDAIPLPQTTLGPGERVVVTLDPANVAEIAADPKFEGVVTLFDTRTLGAADRVDFMQWPEDAVLARYPDERGLFRYCTNSTPGEPNTCNALASREVGNRLRHLRTPGDYGALANGETQLGIRGVKFVYDMKSGGVVHLLSTAAWPLHYTFIRQEIYLDPPLDRCDPEQRQQFDRGWYDFSVTEYFVVEGRSFLLGTLSEHSSTGLHAVEFAVGDVIDGTQMKEAFFAAIPHTDAPTSWVLRPQDAGQAVRAKTVEGELPIVSPEQPFQDVTFQPLTEGVAYGTLKFVPNERLYTERLGPDVIVVTDDVPNDIPLVGGLVTEAFQTPLAHVNVLSQNRGTPNAALRDARLVLSEHFDHLVRIEVNGSGLHVSEADLEEAQAYWDSFVPPAANVSPRIDESLRGVQPLSAHSLTSIPAIGAKAAQLAELGRIDRPGKDCDAHSSVLLLPEAAFAIPVVHSREHFEESGARALLLESEASAAFQSDPVARAEALARVRQLILDHPVDPALLAEVEQAAFERWGEERIRLRSSSNTEDLPSFTGAGLYTSVAAYVNDADESVEDGLRTVWSSLWNARAYDERRFAGIDPSNIAMGVLVHPAYQSEEANGVALSRNVLDLIRGDIYYFNVQAGEASVTNPAPGVSTEQLTYNWYRQPLLRYQSESSLLAALDPPRSTVLSATEAQALACAMAAIHEWFLPLLDPSSEDPYFTMESEFKLIGPDRRLLIKQARPHTFGAAHAIGDCREL